jgi:hypothetical protein
MLAGGFAAFVLTCWLSAFVLISFHTGPLGMSTSVGLDQAATLGLIVGIVISICCRRLFFCGRLPGYRSEK